MIRRATQRRAFTLTEMMVATALTLFLMAIISAAFRAGLDTFSKLNTANAQQQKLSNIKKIISRDLGADHFEGPYLEGFNGPKISDQRSNRFGYRPPAKGYFYLSQGATSVYEPSGAAQSDGESLYSTRHGASVDNYFSFTMRNPSLGYADQFVGRLQVVRGGATPVPSLPYVLGTQNPNNVNWIDSAVYSPWAQVHYFLVDTGEVTDPGPTGTQLPLYSLRRQLFALAPDDAAAQVDIPVNMTGTNVVKNLRVKTVVGAPANTVRLVSASEALTTPFVDPQNPLTSVTRPMADSNGDDILLVDVVSFEVKVWWDGLQAGIPSGDLRVAGANGLDYVHRPILNAPYPAAPRYHVNVPPDPAPYYPPLLNSVEDSRYLTADLTGTDWPFAELPGSTVNGWGYPRTYSTGSRNPGNEPDWDNLPSTTVQANAERTAGQYRQPLHIRIKALQIKVRIWDRKTKQARQLTFIQEV